jgi:hypothetical protein
VAAPDRNGLDYSGLRIRPQILSNARKMTVGWMKQKWWKRVERVSVMQINKKGPMLPTSRISAAD